MNRTKVHIFWQFTHSIRKLQGSNFGKFRGWKSDTGGAKSNSRWKMGKLSIPPIIIVVLYLHI
jgi:hypothetical protein